MTFSKRSIFVRWRAFRGRPAFERRGATALFGVLRLGGACETSRALGAPPRDAQGFAELYGPDPQGDVGSEVRRVWSGVVWAGSSRAVGAGSCQEPGVQRQVCTFDCP